MIAKRFMFGLTVCGGFLLALPARADDPITSPLTAGARAGTRTATQSGLTTGVNSVLSTQTAGALSNGIGQIVSGWTHEGIHGRELAQRIHELQATRRGWQIPRELEDAGQPWRKAVNDKYDSRGWAKDKTWHWDDFPGQGRPAWAGPKDFRPGTGPLKGNGWGKGRGGKR
jgi:hypothetical protein